MTLPAGLAWRTCHAPQAPGRDKPAAPKTQAEAPNQDQPQTTVGASGGQGGQGGQGGPASPCGGEMIWMMGLMFLILYFLMIRPGQKQEKQLKQMRSSLLKGDRVVTSGGMHGTILEVDEKAHTITLKTDEDGRVRMTFDASAIARKAGGDAELTKT
jgi:preprotein translocase subunit YajC